MSPILFASLISGLLAQIFKVIRSSYREGKFDYKYISSSGGFPSTHAAFTSGLAISTILFLGFNSALSAIAVIFALVTIFDAMGVRKLAERHSVVLNKLLTLLDNDSQKTGNKELKDEFDKLRLLKLSENAGHTPKQVFAGIILGLIISIFVYLVWK